MRNQIELRAAADGTATISGTASEYGVSYAMGSYTETIAPGAATATLAAQPDVLLRIDHEIAIARTPETLRVWQDGVGLHYEAKVDPLNDSDARTAVSRIERGVYRESSFAFRVPPNADEWNADFTRRTIKAFDLNRGDVAICPYGASPTTTVTVHRATAGTVEERRAMASTISATGWCGPGLLRQMGAAGYTMPEDAEECAACNGTGWAPDHVGTCRICGGTGWIDPTDTGDGRAGESTVVALARKQRPTGRSKPATPAALRQRAATLRSRATEIEAEELIGCARRQRGLPEHDALVEFRKYSCMAAEARSRGDHATASSFARAAETEALIAASGL